MEAAAAVACRGGGVLPRARPGHRAPHHGTVGAARRRRFLVVALGENPSAAAPPSNAVAFAQETSRVEDDVAASTPIPPPPDDQETGLNSRSSSSRSSPDLAKTTARVKFLLQKRCAFGQRFLVVGDDPALGLWDPAKAAALEWSEGHVWTATKDLPANKSVEFKFLLQDPSGQVSWQHGHNRTLRVAETSKTKTLVVYEDWDDPKCQEVSEVVYPSVEVEDDDYAGLLGNGAMLADDNQIDVNQQIVEDLTDGDSSPSREKMEPNDANGPQFNLEEDQKIPNVLRRGAKMAAQSGNAAADHAGRNGESSSILYEEGAPVENMPATMIENDMVWLRKAMQRLLRILGLQISAKQG